MLLSHLEKLQIRLNRVLSHWQLKPNNTPGHFVLSVLLLYVPGQGISIPLHNLAFFALLLPGIILLEQIMPPVPAQVFTSISYVFLLMHEKN